MRGLIFASGFLAVSLSPALAQNKPAINLVPHRAVYDLSLAQSAGSRGVDSANGRIALDFGGDACDGYTLKYRQVTVLNSTETGSRTIDSRTATYETGDGLSMRFKSESSTGGISKDALDGEAQVKPDGNLTVKIKGEKSDTFSATGHPIFPTEHMKRLIEAALAGQPTLSIKVYDGSDGGNKIYDTLAVIGKKIEGGAGNNLEEPAKQGALANVARWPVTISYYGAGQGDQTPNYVMSFDLYENGISRALKIDYGDFAIRGDLKSLEVNAAKSSCQR